MPPRFMRWSYLWIHIIRRHRPFLDCLFGGPKGEVDVWLVATRSELGRWKKAPLRSCSFYPIQSGKPHKLPREPWQLHQSSVAPTTSVRPPQIVQTWEITTKIRPPSATTIFGKISTPAHLQVGIGRCNLPCAALVQNVSKSHWKPPVTDNWHHVADAPPGSS